MTGPLKWHGGKSYLAKRIIALMPPRCKNPNAPAVDDAGYLHFVEPYAGGLSVLLANDPEGISEVANDINVELTNFWTVLQNGKLFDLFFRIITAVPFSKDEYDAAVDGLKQSCQDNGYDHAGGNVVVRAAWFFIACRQSLAGRMKGFTGITKTRTRRGMNNEVSAWLTCIEGLPAVHERLKRVLILNDPALDVIRKHDGPRTLYYCDPPYLHETRATTGEYAHEMDNDNHRFLLSVLKIIDGRFLLSGYRSKLYDDFAESCGWNRHDFKIANHAAGGKEKRRMVESVWTNF